MDRYCHISVAVPMMAEYANTPRMLQLLRKQRDCSFAVYICVNQPEGWHEEEAHQPIFEDNQRTLALLREVDDLPLTIIDRSSVGEGWTGKRKGVGWARKLLFEKIAEVSDSNELIVSLDADTDFSDSYLHTVLETMNAHPRCSAIGVPFYHPLSGDEQTDRPMLRYECYMRHYFLQMLRIGNPYAFSALGSAMAFPVWAYKKTGGIAPLQGGEDFYLMQSFCKTGSVLRGSDSNLIVRPQGRLSARVPFGTGPAVALGIEQQAARYPFYPQRGFDSIKETTDIFQELYEHDHETPMTAFLQEILGTEDLWGSLRKNFKRQELFVRACHERVDGLRILQYLKRFPTQGNEAEFQTFCQHIGITLPQGFSFATTPIQAIDSIRNELFHYEMRQRQTAEIL